MEQRGRRPARITGDDRHDAILSTAERLLDGRSLDDIPIEELAGGAGISRSNFYFYFASKDDVLLALLDRVITEVQHRVAALPRDLGHEPQAAWRRSIGVFVDVFSAHRAVSVAAIGARGRSPEIEALWSRSMQAWVDFSREAIAAEQARGAAPTGISAGDLAVSLNLMNERVLVAALADESLSVTRDAVLDVLAGIWLRSIYAAP